MAGSPELHTRLLQGDVEGGTEAEYALQMLQMLMDSLGSAVFWKDLDSRFIGCNRAFAEFAGLEPREVIGRTDHDMPWFGEAGGYVDWDRQVIESGEPRLKILERLTDTTGALRRLETNKSPIRSASGQIVGVLGSFRDVTDEIEAHNVLQETLDDLDDRVRAATIELARSNASLRREVTDRVRAETEERRLREYAEHTSETMTQMSRTLDLDEALDALVDGVHRTVSADFVAVILEDHGTRRLAATTSPGGDRSPDLFLVDLSAISALAHPGRQLNDPTITFGHARSTIAVELRTGGVRLGFVVVESQLQDLYSDRHLDRLAAIAGLAAPVIANILSTLMASALAVETELDRVSREVHDTLGQTLWAAVIGSSTALEHVADDHPARALLEQSLSAIQDAAAQVQDLLIDLREPKAASSIVELIESFVWSSAVEVRANVAAEASLSPSQRQALFLVAREALRNVDRHAHATLVEVTLRDEGSKGFRLCISDDGIGFDPAAKQPTDRQRTGLRSMRLRAAALGGELAVRTRPSGGTVIEVVLSHSVGVDR